MKEQAGIIEDLMQPRYRVIADYPNSSFTIGFVKAFRTWDEANDDDMYCKYPHLFKKLEWWEEREGVDWLLSIKFAKVINYVGYWREGDIVPVEDYLFKPHNTDPKFMQLVLQYNKPHRLENVIPATKEEYESQSKQ